MPLMRFDRRPASHSLADTGRSPPTPTPTSHAGNRLTAGAAWLFTGAAKPDAGADARFAGPIPTPIHALGGCESPMQLGCLVWVGGWPLQYQVVQVAEGCLLPYLIQLQGVQGCLSKNSVDLSCSSSRLGW